MDKATESVCPRGWTLPNQTQILSIGNSTVTYIANFNPAAGGFYNNSTLSNEATHGFWWGSEAYNGTTRYSLFYNGDVLYTTNSRYRYAGLYIRCVQAP